MNSLKNIFATALLWLTFILSSHAGTLTYIYTDPQGTPLAEADVNGNITASFDYRPYGSQALGASTNGPGYTGHVSDAESGFVYMQARYYDPVTGRFLSSDPVGPSGGDPFSFNRYAYTNNNPVVGIDPDGRQCAQCLYWPGESLERQASINAAASGQALVGTALILPLLPAIEFVGATAVVVGADTVAHGSIAAGILLNTPAVVVSGAIVADTVAAANGMPGPSSAEEMADFAFAAGRTRGAAAELRIGERVFVDVSTGGAARNLHPNVLSALDRVPQAQRAPWHGHCAEMGCLSQALEAGVNPAGGGSRAVNIGESGRGHGTPKTTCSSCAHVLDEFGVTHD